MNDPFEFLGWNLQDTKTRAKMRQWNADWNAELGILCFSCKWSNPLLWGHYADKHRGMAIGFDVPDNDRYSPVKYCRNRLPTPAGSELVDVDDHGLLLTKFSAWRYESEYRCFYRLGESIHEKGLYFEPFSSILKLAEVIVGDQSTITRAELADALGDLNSNLPTFKARPAFGTFSVVKNRNAALWK